MPESLPIFHRSFSRCLKSFVLFKTRRLSDNLFNMKRILRARRFLSLWVVISFLFDLKLGPSHAAGALVRPVPAAPSIFIQEAVVQEGLWTTKSFLKRLSSNIKHLTGLPYAV